MNASVAATNFTAWGQALLTREPAKVAALYAENMTLLPTLAAKTISTYDGVIEYFTFFLSLQPSVTMVEEHVDVIDADSYLHCGVYRFALVIDGISQTVDARFSMVWKKTSEEWRLLHHHSSRVPVM